MNQFSERGISFGGNGRRNSEMENIEVLVRPRLNDYHGILMLQDKVDFAIPFLDEDIPLYVDPFLLWKSPSQMDNGLHDSIIQSFNHLGYLVNKGNYQGAADLLISLSESDAVGLGTSKTRKGSRIGDKVANDVLSLFENIPQLKTAGFSHIEEIQLLVGQVAKDRVSDIACNLISSFLIDYTMQRCEENKIPMEHVTMESVYDAKLHKLKTESVYLPVNPNTKQPILFVPKRWLRFSSWIGMDDYFSNYYSENVDKGFFFKDRIRIIDYNRQNYDFVRGYVEAKERSYADCHNDPLFIQLPLTSAKRKMKDIVKLPTGKTDNADKKYENYVVQFLASLLYPHLDFAEGQSRTDSGAQIRDLIFYNNHSIPFFKEIYETYGSKQIVFELKNVESLNRDNVNQLNRYLNDNLGKFGVFVTRHKPPRNIQKHLIDLWSGQRKCILVLDDSDLQMMTDIFENKQRFPYEVIKKKYCEFLRKCPT